MKIIKKVLITAFISAAALSMAGCSKTPSVPSPDNQNTSERTIKVQSTEEVNVVPDIAKIYFSVSTQAGDAKTCQQKNSEQLEKVIASLKSSGIDEKSIQTSNYDLRPVYDWDADKKITGYEMNTDLVVSDIPIEKLGNLLSSSVDAGANNIKNVNYIYMYSQYDKTYQEALNKSIQTAKVKAQAMADTCGCTLGEVLNLEELSNYSEARNQTYKSIENAPVQETDPMAVEPGQIKIKAQVSVTYHIQ